MAKKIPIIISSLICFSVLFLTVGYSAFQNTVVIDKISAVTRVQADIRVTNFLPSSGSAGSQTLYEDYNVSMVGGTVVLPNADSTYTYQMEVTNFGNIKMVIKNIYGLPDNLDYELSNYVLKDYICDENDVCTLGAKKYIDFTIKYKDGMYDSSNTTHDFVANIEFRRTYSVTYVGIKDNNQYPKYVVDGDNLNVVFAADVPRDYNTTANYPANVTISMDGGTAQFTYNNSHRLVVNSVTGDLIVNRVYRLYERILQDNPITDGCPEVISNRFAKLTTIETGEKFCMLPDDYGNSFYFRGSNTNNYFWLNGMYFRIMRVNGNHTVRMIYAGTTGMINGTNDKGKNQAIPYSNVSETAFARARTANAYVGYMYGSTSTTATYAQTHTNTNSSVAKTSAESWYSTAFTDRQKHFMADSYFCADRSLYSNTGVSNLGIQQATSLPSTSDYKPDTSGSTAGTGTVTTLYGGFYRLIVPSEKTFSSYVSTDAKYNSYPTLKCNRANDRLTVSAGTSPTTRGVLGAPVGLPTADEVFLAGTMNKDRASYNSGNVTNTQYYMYTGFHFWTMTPAFYGGYAGGFSAMGVVNDTSKGWVSGAATINTTDSRYIRTVINIRADAVVATGTAGTKNNPYKLSGKLEYNQDVPSD